MKKSFQVTREFCTIQDIPIISTATEVFLKNRLVQYKLKSIAEVWSAVWYSTSILSETMSHYTTYWTIDSREISYPHYRQSVLTTKDYLHTTIYLGNICHIELWKYISKQYDLLFIDGRKSETLFYLKKFLPYISNTSHIIIDDAIKFKEKMINCYQFLDNNNIEYTVHNLDTDDGIITIQVQPPFLQALSSLSDL